MKPCRLLAALALGLAQGTAAFAQAASAPLRFKTEASSPQAMGEGALPVLWLLGALVLVLAWWWVKSGRPVPKWGPTVQRTPRITVLDSQVIGPSQRIVCVRFQGRELLLGVAAERVTLLAEHPADHPAVPPITPSDPEGETRP